MKGQKKEKDKDFSGEELRSLLLSNDDSEGFITANKSLIHAIGLHETIIYHELVSKWVYYQNNEIVDDNEFYCTGDDLLRASGLTQDAQPKIINRLQELKLIDCAVKGIPPRRFYKILNTRSPDDENDHLICKYISNGNEIISLIREQNQIKARKIKNKSPVLDAETKEIKEKIKILKDYRP